MKKIFPCILLIVVFSFKVMGNDAANEMIEQTNRLSEARRIFETTSEKDASAINIAEVLLWKDCAGKKSIAVIYAIKIYTLTSDDLPSKKRSVILNCVKNNSSDAGILYASAAFLESFKESEEIYERIVENDDFDTGFRLLSLKKLFQSKVLPQSTPKVLIKGALSTIPAEQKLFLELLSQLKSLNSKAAFEYINLIDAAMKQKTDKQYRLRQQVK